MKLPGKQPAPRALHATLQAPFSGEPQICRKCTGSGGDPVTARWAGQPQSCTCTRKTVATIEETLSCPVGWKYAPGIGWTHALPPRRLRRPDPAASVALIPAAAAATAAACAQWVIAALFAFLAVCLLALLWNVAHEPDDLDALIEATREPIHVPDYVPAEWVKEAGR